MPWATLTSSTSYLKRKATSSLDFSDFANVLTGLTTVSPLLDRFTTDNFIQEVRLSSSAEHPFKWLVGGFFEDYERSEEHTSELQSLMRISYAVFCLKKKNNNTNIHDTIHKAHNKHN